MEKMEGEPGRDAKADQVQKTQCKDTTSHCFMRVLIENNTDGSAFRFPTVAYQMQWAHIDQCVRNDFEVSKPRFLGHTGQVMGPWQSHRGNGAQRQM